MNKYTVVVGGGHFETVMGDRHVLACNGLALYVGENLVGHFPKYEALLCDVSPPCLAQPAPISVVETPGITAHVELVAGEALLVNSPLCEAIESTARILSKGADDRLGGVFRQHLRDLLREQKEQLFTSRSGSVAQHIGTV